jgi:hypothetical protein
MSDREVMEVIVRSNGMRPTSEAVGTESRLCGSGRHIAVIKQSVGA